MTNNKLDWNVAKSKLKFCIASAISFAVVTTTVNPAEGVQLTYSSPGNVSKIEDLVVDGVTYDVTFKSDTFLNLFGSPSNPSFNAPNFWNNQQGASQVVNEIVSLLKNQPTIPSKINNTSSILVPYRGIVASNQSLFVVNKIADYITQWSNFRGESQDIFVLGNVTANYALITPKETKPIPESNLVIGLVGVASLLGLKSKKKRTVLH
ncbi:hypothetical protein NUACC21_03420 [Scytonema sp. NUACC21]